MNEGNFSRLNSSLSIYDKETREVANQCFTAINNRPLGDVGQAIEIFDSLAFIVVNNSSKLEAINLRNIESIRTIDGFMSPRNILKISDTLALVSDLVSPKISVVNTRTMTIDAQIQCRHSTEALIMHNEKIYASCWSHDSLVLVIDAKTLTISDSIVVPKQPNSMVIDKNGKLWVLCDGGYTGSQIGQDFAALACINLSSNEIEKTFRFSNINNNPTRLCINATKDILYYIDNDVFEFLIDANSISNTPLIQSSNGLFYGLAYDSDENELYVSDALDYQQRGYVYRCSTNGEITDTILVGIIPSDIIVE